MKTLTKTIPQPAEWPCFAILEAATAIIDNHVALFPGVPVHYMTDEIKEKLAAAGLINPEWDTIEFPMPNNGSARCHVENIPATLKRLRKEWNAMKKVVSNRNADREDYYLWNRLEETKNVAPMPNVPRHDKGLNILFKKHLQSYFPGHF